MASWQKTIQYSIHLLKTYGKHYDKILKAIKCSSGQIFKTWDKVRLHTKSMGMHFISHSKLKCLWYQTGYHHSHFGTQFCQLSWKFDDRVLHNDCHCYTCNITFQKQGIPLVCVLVHTCHTWACHYYHKPQYFTLLVLCHNI